MATHSNTLAWRIPGTAESGELQSMGSQSWTHLKWLSMHYQTMMVLIYISEFLSLVHLEAFLASFPAFSCAFFFKFFIFMFFIYSSFWLSFPSEVLCLFSLSEEKVKSLSRVQLFATPWTVACRAPPSTVFSKQEYGSRLPLPSLWDRPNSEIKPESPTLQADSLPSEPPGKSYFCFTKVQFTETISQGTEWCTGMNLSRHMDSLKI